MYEGRAFIAFKTILTVRLKRISVVYQGGKNVTTLVLCCSVECQAFAGVKKELKAALLYVVLLYGVLLGQTPDKKWSG